MNQLKNEILENSNKNYSLILLGNIINKHFSGENKEIKSGTKQFRAGAKVVLFPEYGGMGHEAIPVYGLPKKSVKKIKIVIRSEMIKNVRVKKTFDPKLVEMAKSNHFYNNIGNKENELYSFAESFNEHNKEIE